MNSRQAGPRQVAEIRYGSHPGAVAAVGAHPLHTFWPLLSPHFRGVWLAPQRRSDGASVSWIWRQPTEKREPGAQDLATLRRRLQESAAGFSEDPLGSVDETVARATSEAVVRQVCARAAEVVAGLVAKSDADLAAYVAVTETGLRLHSWGADIPAPPQDPSAQQCEISGTVFAADKPAARFMVALENSRGLTLARTESGSEGHFAFPDIGPGSYRVRVLSEHVPFSVKGVTVRVEQESVRGIELRSHALIDAPDEETASVDTTVAPPAPFTPPTVSPPPIVDTHPGRRRARRLLLLLLLLAVGIAGGAMAWFARRAPPPAAIRPSSFVAYAPPASAAPSVERTDGSERSDPGINLGAAVDRPRLGSSSASPSDFASRTSLSSAPQVAAAAAPVATAPGAVDGEGWKPEAAGGEPGGPPAGLPSGATTPEPAGAAEAGSTAGQTAAVVGSPGASRANAAHAGDKGTITTSQPAGESKPRPPRRHTSPLPTQVPRQPALDSKAADAAETDDADDTDIPLDADARAERAARRAVSDGKATAKEETRAATDTADTAAADTSDQGETGPPSLSADPSAPEGPPEHDDPLEERPDREDEPSDREAPEEALSDEERSDPVEESADPVDERQDDEASTENAPPRSSDLAREGTRRTPRASSAGPAGGRVSPDAAATSRRPAQRTPRADAHPTMPGTLSAEHGSAPPGLGYSVTLRMETWHPRLEVDVIVPTAPVPRSSGDTTRALLHDAQAEATSRLPELFQLPMTQAGVILDVDAALLRAGALRWSHAAADGVTARCLGARAELGWHGQVAPVSSAWTLHGAHGAILARLQTDRAGILTLDTAPEVRASLWVGLRRPLTASRPEHAPQWAARLRWTLQQDGQAAATGHRDDSWLGASGHRLEFPLPRSAQSPTALTVRLRDRQSGWALVRRVHLR